MNFLVVPGSKGLLMNTSRQLASSVRCLVLCGAFLAGLSRPSLAADTVTVNLNSVITTMPANGIGVNASVYYNNFSDNAWIPGELDAAGVTTVRYPGGSYSDGYQFATNSGVGLYVGPNMDFNNFEQVVLTGNPKSTIITVDYGSNLNGTMGGQPQEAAAWVALADGNASLYNSGHDVTIGSDAGGVNWGTVGYWAHLRTLTPAQAAADPNYNGSAAGTPAHSIGENLSFLAMNHSASYGIQNWEVGNELFGNGYFGTDQNWETDLHYTGTGASRQGQAALSPAAYGTNVNAFVTAMKAVDPTIQIGAALNDDPNWDPNVLKQSGANINYGIFHYYPTAGNSDGSATAATDSSFITSQATAIPSMIAGERSLINGNAGANAANIAIDVTEFGQFGTLANPKNFALYATEAYAAFMESGVPNADVWEMMTKNFFDTDSQSATPVEGPSYFGTKMMHELASPGDTFVTTTSNTSTLLTHATVRPNGQVVVLLINAGLSANSVTINLGSGSYLSSGTLYSTDGSANVATSLVTGLSNAFTVSVPSFTEYAYVLTPTPGPPFTWTNTGGSGSWNGAANWSPAGGPPNLPGATGIFAAASPIGTVTLDGNQTVGFLQFNNGASGLGMIINAGSPAGTLIARQRQCNGDDHRLRRPAHNQRPGRLQQPGQLQHYDGRIGDRTEDQRADFRRAVGIGEQLRADRQWHVDARQRRPDQRKHGRFRVGQRDAGISRLGFAIEPVGKHRQQFQRRWNRRRTAGLQQRQSECGNRHRQRQHNRQLGRQPDRLRNPAKLADDQRQR